MSSSLTNRKRGYSDELEIHSPDMLAETMCHPYWKTWALRQHWLRYDKGCNEWKIARSMTIRECDYEKACKGVLAPNEICSIVIEAYEEKYKRRSARNRIIKKITNGELDLPDTVSTDHLPIVEKVLSDRSIFEPQMEPEKCYELDELSGTYKIWSRERLNRRHYQLALQGTLGPEEVNMKVIESYEDKRNRRRQRYMREKGIERGSRHETPQNNEGMDSSVSSHLFSFVKQEIAEDELSVPSELSSALRLLGQKMDGTPKVNGGIVLKDLLTTKEDYEENDRKREEAIREGSHGGLTVREYCKQTMNVSMRDYSNHIWTEEKTADFVSKFQQTLAEMVPVREEIRVVTREGGIGEDSGYEGLPSGSHSNASSTESDRYCDSPIEQQSLKHLSRINELESELNRRVQADSALSQMLRMAVDNYAVSTESKEIISAVIARLDVRNT